MVNLSRSSISLNLEKKEYYIFLEIDEYLKILGSQNFQKWDFFKKNLLDRTSSSCDHEDFNAKLITTSSLLYIKFIIIFFIKRKNNILSLKTYKKTHYP